MSNQLLTQTSVRALEVLNLVLIHLNKHHGPKTILERPYVSFQTGKTDRHNRKTRGREERGATSAKMTAPSCAIRFH